MIGVISPWIRKLNDIQYAMILPLEKKRNIRLNIRVGRLKQENFLVVKFFLGRL